MSTLQFSNKIVSNGLDFYSFETQNFYSKKRNKRLEKKLKLGSYLNLSVVCEFTIKFDKKLELKNKEDKFYFHDELFEFIESLDTGRYFENLFAGTNKDGSTNVSVYWQLNKADFENQAALDRTKDYFKDKMENEVFNFKDYKGIIEIKEVVIFDLER